jgi:hypothetical protein
MRARKKDESVSARPSIGWEECAVAGAAEGGLALDFDGFGGDRRDSERDTLCSAIDRGTTRGRDPGRSGTPARIARSG